MRRLLTGFAIAGVLVAAASGPVAARPAPTYEATMTVDGCDFTFNASWTRAKVEQTYATFVLPESYQGISYGAGSHQPLTGAFKNYGNNQVIRIHQLVSPEQRTFQFDVYFFAADATVLNVWRSDAVTLYCE